MIDPLLSEFALHPVSKACNNNANILPGQDVDKCLELVEFFFHITHTIFLLSNHVHKLPL